VKAMTDGGDSSGSQVFNWDSVRHFDVSGTVNNDKLSLASNTIAGNAAHVDGTDVGALAKHSIVSGILTFENASGTAISINETNLQNAIDYLEANIPTPGLTVAFGADEDGNGNNDSLFVFQNQGGPDLDNDTLIALEGINGVTLGTTAAQNVVQIVDTTGPNPFDASFTTVANAVFSLEFNENVLVTNTTGLTLTKNGSGANIATGVSAAANVLNVQTNATLAATDFVLVSYNGATGNVRDASGNKFSDILPGIAIGGAGNTVINLSAKAPLVDGTGYGLYDPHGGNDTLTGTTGDDELDGGAGADTLTGGAGLDRFGFGQGDSPVVTFTDNGAVGFSDGDTYAFAGGAADLITDFTNVGDHIEVWSTYGDMHGQSMPASGLVTDQSRSTVRGDYSAGVFTVNVVSGHDTLVVYDGVGGADVTQTGLVIQNVTTSSITDNGWQLSRIAANLNAPVITSNGSGATASLNVAENATAVTTVTATDADASTLSYSIVGGVDAAKFGINSTSGALSFIAGPDFEAPTDSGANNVYDVVVQVGDGVYTDTQTLAVTVTDVVEGGDTTAPILTGASFTNAANSIITLTFDEAVTATNTLGITFSLNPTDANGWMGTPINLTGNPTGLGTSTVNFTTSATLSATDVVQMRYDSGPGNVQDTSGNAVASGEIFFGGSGNNTIDLDWYWPWTGFPVSLRGNAGADTLVGTEFNDLLVDGGGADTVLGGMGADIIRLVENGTDKPYLKDIIKIELGESPSTGVAVPNIAGVDFDIVMGSSTSPTGTGFDIISAIVANHDVLDLPSNAIASNASHTDGIDSGALAKHSISNGILTFENAANAATLINLSNAEAAINYLEANITNHSTVAFEMDTDGNGNADSMVVFQDAGTIPLAGNLAIPDVAVILSGITGATLGTTAGANVVQIQDTQAPNPVGFSLINDGLSIDVSENAFASTNLALPMFKNGTTAMNITSIGGNGTTSLSVHTNQTLAATDWVLLNYNGTTVADAFSDSSGNVMADDSTEQMSGEAWGGSGNNTINLSARAVANPTTDGYSMEGFAGNDILTGSAGDDWIAGGMGADTLSGGNGGDSYTFEQGDSPAVTGKNLGVDGVLNTGDTFSFASGVDRITDFSSGDSGFDLDIPLGDVFGNAGAPGYMGSMPSNGLATDQGYFAVQGNYAGTTFTVNTVAGADSLIVWDGDSSSAVTQTGLVLSGVTLAELNLYAGNNWISHV
jgi:hypothetical protein